MVSRFAQYSLCSTLLLGGTAYHAYSRCRQFYPAMVYLSSSKVSALVLGNQSLLLVLLFARLLKHLFFGSLRTAELEHLYDRSWLMITETCLAMTIFREEFNVRFVIMFTILLFIKSFHWLLRDRISYLEQVYIYREREREIVRPLFYPRFYPRFYPIFYPIFCPLFVPALLPALCTRPSTRSLYPLFVPALCTRSLYPLFVTPLVPACSASSPVSFSVS